MKIQSFKDENKYKNVFKKDSNNREINLYKISKVRLTGHSLFYPNVLLKTKNNLILPLLERTMSLKSGTIYEKQNMEYKYEYIINEREVREELFFFYL